ncbi:HEAT repeat domain-containing protein [Streptomyces sp. VRA16 Mangrove soil]|uniref:HEAT repeat domain-containing protein n=1 Tax=Streptomyces sp. VRA16 Mangrove soil TaxID=2817434 RepID=UPI001A9E763E|nr:HEAT repeat domain-containing protein [Streptomyces sp. VRA16 Mangrove soil]MBO1331714.1 hypothetical protein [Streptomyces sp. VRA16 Mangrove soil]
MDVIADLADPELRDTARELLAALGTVAVPRLLAELVDEESPVPEHEIEFVLTAKIGPPAYDAVVAALAAAEGEQARRRLSRTVSGIRDLGSHLGALGHPSPEVRRSAAFGVQNLCSTAYGREPRPDIDSPAVIAALLPLLDDPDAEVARRAEWALSTLGSDVEEPLRRIRREGPGRLRATALSLLAEAGGEEALSAADRAAVERLIRIKLPDDRARPLDTCFTYWIAVPGGDGRGIADLLGLYDARPATFALGHSVAVDDSHDGGEFGRVYVTPEVDGWTLVVGPWCDPCDDERAADVLDLVTRLSRRYGRAQAYYFGDQGDGSAWLVAEHGTVVRRCLATGASGDDRFTLGERLPEELAACAGEGLSPDDPEDWAEYAPYAAPELARRLGVSPFALGPDTEVRGAGFIALTPYARRHGRPRTGAYRI